MNDDKDSIFLEDLTYDFEDYFDKYFKKELSEEERNLFMSRVIGHFCRDFYKNGNPADVPKWIMSFVADGLYKVLAGEEWAHEFPLPWTTETPIRTRAEQLALDLFCYISNFKTDNPAEKTTDVIAGAAKKFNVSYETARAAYYKYKSHLSKAPPVLKIVT